MAHASRRPWAFYCHSLPLQAGISTARSRLGADCRRDDIKPVSCVITSGESAFIQVRRLPPPPDADPSAHIIASDVFRSL